MSTDGESPHVSVHVHAANSGGKSEVEAGGKCSAAGVFKSFTDKDIKAQAVVTKDEISRIVDLGLGRGLDVTKTSPWVDKSSFQVREVTIESVVGTEEGGSLQSYEREISSVQNLQTAVEGSVAVPNSPVTLGLEGELSRSVSSTRKAVGMKIHNRTVTFRTGFKDSPLLDTNDLNAARLEPMVENPSSSLYCIPPDPEPAEVTTPSGLSSFEERLCIWIIDRIMLRQQRPKESEESCARCFKFSGKAPIIDLADYVRQASNDELKELVKDCSQFVYHFRITHYVQGIELGASVYRVFSEKEYYYQVSSRGSFGFEAIAKSSLSAKGSLKTTSKSSDVRQIGKIEDEAVERGSYNEAVVGIQIQPISHLVNLRFLHLALRKALMDYINNQGSTKSGPFLLGCFNEKVFLTVNQENGFALEGTTDIKKASLFTIAANDDTDHPHEFLIAYMEEDHQKAKEMKREDSALNIDTEVYSKYLPRYLSAPLGLFGHNHGPLRFENRVRKRWSRFIFQSRIVGSLAPIFDGNLTDDRYFIQCARRKGRVNGYLALRRTGRAPNYRYSSACFPRMNSHNDSTVGMLFRPLDPSTYMREGGDTGRSKTKHYSTTEFAEIFASD